MSKKQILGGLMGAEFKFWGSSTPSPLGLVTFSTGHHVPQKNAVLR